MKVYPRYDVEFENLYAVGDYVWELITGTRDMKLGHMRRKEGLKRPDDGVRAPVFMPEMDGAMGGYRGGVTYVMESCRSKYEEED